jgi:hypothetical protein
MMIVTHPRHVSCTMIATNIEEMFHMKLCRLSCIRNKRKSRARLVFAQELLAAGSESSTRRHRYGKRAHAGRKTSPQKQGKFISVRRVRQMCLTGDFASRVMITG